MTSVVRQGDAKAMQPVHVLQPAAPVAPSQAWRNWAGFLQLLPGEISRAVPPFIPTGEMPNRGWYEHLHSLTAEVSAIGCHLVRDAVITGQGYVFHEGRFLVQDVYLHDVAMQDLAAQPDLLPTAQQTKRGRQLDRPVLEILGPGSPVYGHWLVDFLPRAAIARETLGEAFHRFIIPLPDDLPDWTIELLCKFVDFRPENALRYDARTEYLFCRRLCIPTFGHSAKAYYFHSFVRDFYARHQLRPAYRARRLCLSRRNFEHETRGVLKGFSQRHYMEAAATRLGFEVVCPEELSLGQQVELFSQAGLVVGEYGSALHNTLFSPARTIIGSVRYPNSIQTRIAALMGQDVMYLIPDHDTIDQRGAEIYQVSEDKIDRFLDQLVRLHVNSSFPAED